MVWQISQTTKLTFGGLLLAAIFLVIISWAAGKGKASAQAQAAIQTAQNTQTALGYFYQDQNRYPTAVEFADQNVMLAYLTAFPLPEFPSAVCSQSFNYTYISQNSYQLGFCLPVAAGNFKAGWSTVSGSPPSVSP